LKSPFLLSPIQRQNYLQHKLGGKIERGERRNEEVVGKGKTRTCCQVHQATTPKPQEQRGDARGRLKQLEWRHDSPASMEISSRLPVVRITPEASGSATSTL